MKKIKIQLHLSIGYISSREDKMEIEVDENATEEEIQKEIDEVAEYWASNFIEYGAKIIT